MDKIPITPDGLLFLEAELRDLKMVQRPEIIDAIAQARALGDLSENAEYQYAKERQAVIEGRIQEVEAKIARAEVIDITKLSGSNVKFGATVTILDLDESVEHVYRIVGADQADISAGLLSIASPLAKILIGKESGDEVEFTTPGGQRHYEILKVEYK